MTPERRVPSEFSNGAGCAIAGFLAAAGVVGTLIHIGTSPDRRTHLPPDTPGISQGGIPQRETLFDINNPKGLNCVPPPKLFK